VVGYKRLGCITAGTRPVARRASTMSLAFWLVGAATGLLLCGSLF